MIKLKFKDGSITDVDRKPNKCPYCHTLIDASSIEYNISCNYLEIIFRCTNEYCNRSFISSYQYYGNSYYYKSTNIGNLIKQPFNGIITLISPSFINIYNEAYFAEQHNLMEICGVGYRKALEYLIKEYLIKNNPVKEEQIKKKFLGKCIKDDVSDLKIKKAADRAVWLGNDETHYERKWEGKTLEDLKKLIELTVNWIEMEELSKSFEESMPDNK